MSIRMSKSNAILQRGYTQPNLMLSNSLQVEENASFTASSQNFASIIGGKYQEKINETEEHLNNLAATRAAATYFDKFDKEDLQEILTYSGLDWLLSVEDTRLAVEPPSGIISELDEIGELDEILLAIPTEYDIQSLELRELHQIIRELVLGIYVLNETPSISLDVNFDQSTSCHLPPGYHDTRVGQLLISVDYMLKSLWHGVYFPREKRGKFAERWRQGVNLNAMTGEPETKRNIDLIWAEAGLLDIAKDPELAHVYDSIPAALDDIRSARVVEERKYFMRHIDDIAMHITFRQNSIQRYDNMFLVDAVYEVSSVIKGDKLDMGGYKRINKRLSCHADFLKNSIISKKETAREVVLLQLVSFFVPFLIALKRRGKVPDLNAFLPPLTHEDCKTERELSPIVILPNLKCRNFDACNKYLSLHGGIFFERDTPSNIVAPAGEVLAHKSEILQTVSALLQRITKPSGPMLDRYPLIPVSINGFHYYAFSLRLETYYPLQPKAPKWIHAYCDEMTKLKPKKLPMTELQIHEQFRKRFGYQKTVRLKQISLGLQAAAQRGLASVFYTMCRRQPVARLTSQDHHGFSLMHHAAMLNRAPIVTQLIVMGCDVNVKKFGNASSTGTMPVHVASRCGALESLASLVAFNADLRAVDNLGYTSIHYASFYDNVSCIRVLLNQDPGLLELRTLNKTLSTSVLLAASSGALAAVKCLMGYGASVLARDSSGCGIIQLAALGEHTNILKFFVERQRSQVPVWELLVAMLGAEKEQMQEKSAKCLEVLTLPPNLHWRTILAAKAVPALVALFQTDNEILQSLSTSILCNIGEHNEARKAIGEAGATSDLIGLLNSPNLTVQSRAAVILADLACLNRYQVEIAKEGGLVALVAILSSPAEHVLVNAVNAIRLLTDANVDNQTGITACGATNTLVTLLGHKSRRLQANTAACISAIAKGHRANQDEFVRHGAIRQLVQLFRCKEQPCQLKAAKALESLTEGNAVAQEELNLHDGAKPLIRLLKLWAIEMKEQGATALWALAGSSLPQQRKIAESIGINILVDMLMIKSEKLQYVAGMALIALGKDNMKSQNRISEGGAIAALVRLLRTTHTPTSRKVLIMAIRVLGVLCVGVAHQPNKAVQCEIAGTEALEVLSSLLVNGSDQEIQVEIAMALSKIVLCNSQAQARLADNQDFSMTYVISLLNSEDQEVKLKATMALATFSYNNSARQSSIKAAGGIALSHFRPFLQSESEEYQAHAAFAVVILAKVICDGDQVTLSALGVETLVQLLNSERFATKILVASLIASLGHTRPGIPDALVTAGAVENLVNNLQFDDNEVRESSAAALGYLSFNRTAARILLVACRNQPKLFDKLVSNINHSKMSATFIEEWKRNVAVGLPSQSLVINGGPPIPTKASNHETTRSKSFVTDPVQRRGRSAEERRSLRLVASMPSPAAFRRPKTASEAVRGKQGQPSKGGVIDKTAELREKKFPKTTAFAAF